MSVLWSVSWYRLRVFWPPMLIAGGVCMKTRRPATLASFGRRRSTIASEESRWPRGFSVTNIEPEFEVEFGPPAPTDD